MLSFVLTGSVGRIIESGDETIIAVSSQRVLKSGGVTVEWVKSSVRCQLLRAKVARCLTAGDTVRIEGEVEPRRREIKGLIFYDVVFVAYWFETLDPPLFLSEAGAAP